MTVVYTLLFLFFIVIIVGPLGFMFWGSVWSTDPLTPGGTFTLNNYITTYLDPATYRLWVNTLIIGLGTTFWANFLGVGMAWIIARTNTPFRRTCLRSRTSS